METMTKEQQKIDRHRRRAARRIAEDHRCWDDSMDYDNGDIREVVEGPEPMPRYASTRYDETYTTMAFSNTLAEAFSALLENVGDDRLSNPGTVFDLDAVKVKNKKGEFPTADTSAAGVPYNIVAMSEEAYAVLCGLVQPSHEVEIDGIHSEAWTELRTLFGLAHFRKWAEDNPDSYAPEFI